MPILSSTEHAFPLVIIGSGYSGTLTAVNYLREHAGRPRHIIMIDQFLLCCRGLAYRSADDNLVLNVPAGNMSA